MDWFDTNTISDNTDMDNGIHMGGSGSGSYSSSVSTAGYGYSSQASGPIFKMHCLDYNCARKKFSYYTAGLDDSITSTNPNDIVWTNAFPEHVNVDGEMFCGRNKFVVQVQCLPPNCSQLRLGCAALDGDVSEGGGSGEVVNSYDISYVMPFTSVGSLEQTSECPADSIMVGMGCNGARTGLDACEAVSLRCATITETYNSSVQ